MNQPTKWFTINELNTHKCEITPEIEANLDVLIERLSQVRDAWGKPMTVTSGLRSQADQARINPLAPKSNHLIGAAADILDEDGSLKKWVGDNLPLMEHIGLWFEAFESTPTWCHMQIFPPKSGKRIFIP
jgi:hypothetical protein